MSDTYGPECPACGFTITPDEPGYYSENDYTEETCSRCNETFDVEVIHSVAWFCTRRDKAATSSEEPREIPDNGNSA